jgi:hypothetical protein
MATLLLLTKTGFVLDEATKKIIKTGNESEKVAAIITVLNSTYKDFNKNLADTPTGQMARLGNAAQNVSIIIGTGLLDSLMILGENTSVSDLATDMETAATGAAELFVTLSKVIKMLREPIDYTAGALAWFIEKTSPFIDLIVLGDPTGLMGLKKPAASKNPIQSGTYLATQKKITKLVQKESAAQTKILKDKKLALAIDKAKLALGKGNDVFNLDAIQLNAALINQADQLGKVTSSAQLLAITNDIARLRVKQDILNLEDAIASGDIKAIESATKKLNEDLKILGVLNSQNLKLVDIKSILDSLMPRDLINLANLDAALAMLNAINSATGKKTVGTTTAASTTSSSGIPVGDYVAPIPTSGVSPAAINEFAAAATARADAMADLIDRQNAADAAALANSSLNSFNITIQTGVGDPNAIAEALDQYLQGAVDRGTLRLR